MNITGTLTKDGQAVTIVNVNVIGYVIYITYIDASNNMIITTDYLPTGTNKTVATGCTIN